jgi:hypothetical protein
MRITPHKRACIFEPRPDLSNPTERFHSDAELLENSVEQWRTDVPPAVDRYSHCPAISVDPTFVTSCLAAQFEPESGRSATKLVCAGG